MGVMLYKQLSKNGGFAPILIIIIFFIILFFGFNLMTDEDCDRNPFICALFGPDESNDSPASTTETAEDPGEITEDKVATARGSKLGVTLTLTFPLKGGGVTGTVSGLCSGSVSGSYAGKGGTISGDVLGAECTVPPIIGTDYIVSGSFSGSVNESGKTVTISGSATGKDKETGEVKSGGGEMTLTYK